MTSDPDKRPSSPTSGPASTPTPAPDAGTPPAPARSTFGQTLNAVLWGFLGVRKRRDLHTDATSVNPVHLILMGIALAAMFVTGLIVLVRFITH
jgi:hypothetical protein